VSEVVPLTAGKGSAGIVCLGLSTAVQEKYGLIGESSAETAKGNVPRRELILHGRVEGAGGKS